MTNLAISIEDVFKVVGELTLELRAAREESQMLKEMVASLQENVATLKASQIEKVNSIVDDS